MTRDGSQTHFSRLRQAIVAPDNDDWSELFTEQLGPRLSRGHQAGLLATLSCSDTPWPICEMVLQQIGRKPTANKRLAALTVTLLQRVRDRGSASQRHLLLQGLRRHSGGDDWPTWMLQMHTSPQKFSMGSMQTECLGVTWADAVWTQTNEGAISEGGRALADSLRPVEGEAN